MRFEVEVDDGNGLKTLHRAREAYNKAHPDKPAGDLPSFVQRLADEAVAIILEPFGVSLDQAQERIAERDSRIAELEAQRDAALAQVAEIKAAPAA